MKFLFYPIYVFFRKNIRPIVALILLGYISYPVIIKVIAVSQSKSFFGTKITKQNPTLKDLKLNKFNLGHFDPNLELTSMKNITFDQSFVNWDHTLEQVNVGKAIESSLAKGLHPVVTIEPWNYSSTDTNIQYFRDIVDGKFDNHIRNLCKKINSYREVILVNWAEGADFGSKSRYSWAIDDANLYKQGYIRWNTKCKEVTNNVIYIWGANGNDKTFDYYPGDQYVDIVGLNMLFNLSDIKDKNNIDKTVSTIIDSKLSYTNKINKIVYLMDLGVESNNSNQEYTKSIFSKLNNNTYPQILGAIYLNTKTSPTLIPGDASKNYSITADTLSKILE